MDPEIAGGWLNYKSSKHHLFGLIINFFLSNKSLKILIFLILAINFYLFIYFI